MSDLEWLAHCIINFEEEEDDLENEIDMDDELEDEEDEMLLLGLGIFERSERRIRPSLPRVKDHVERIVHFYSDSDFRINFRMRRDTFERVLLLIGPSIAPGEKDITIGRERIPAEKQLLMTLWMLAKTDGYRAMTDWFGVGKATGVGSVRRVVLALTDLASDFIKWPSAEECGKNASAFKTASGFPGVIGAIDITPISISAPNHHTNKKTVQLQAVCDYNHLFINCHVGAIGSQADQDVLNNSEIADFLGNDEMFPKDTHLVGGSSLALHRRMMVPYRDDGQLTPAQFSYNLVHTKTHLTIKRAFGFLKGRFKRLAHALPMNRIDLVPKYIKACCVLHNICLQSNDVFDEIPLVLRIADMNCSIQENEVNHVAEQKRMRIANLFHCL